MRVASLIAITVVAASSFVWGEDWPQFRGLHRDGKSSERGLIKQWPADGPRLLWSSAGLGRGYSSAAVAGGMIFTTGMVGEKNEGILSALDLDGKIQWQTHYGPEWGQMNPGSRSTPTIEADRVYELSGVGRLFCLDFKTGAIRWSRDLPKEFNGEAPRCGYAEAPLIYNDKVICTPGGRDASLVALDKLSGKTIWSSAGFSDQSAYCSPILVERGGDKLVITITSRHVVGVDAKTGKVFWAEPFDTNAEDPNHAVTPVASARDADGRLYITSGHRDGGQMFEMSEDGRHVAPRWSDSVLNTNHGGLVLVDGHIYGASSKGKWVCLELATGRVRYEASGVGEGSVAYADGMLYCYGQNGNVGLVRATPEAYEIISRFKVTQGSGPHWAHPTISGGRLYIRHGEVLMAYGLK